MKATYILMAYTENDSLVLLDNADVDFVYDTLNRLKRKNVGSKMKYKVIMKGKEV